jgi:hypothetical protein
MHNAANYRTNCFELFGLDVILDTKLEPSLLEVNISPSLMGSSPLDKKIKGTLVADILHVSSCSLISLCECFDVDWFLSSLGGWYVPA